MAGRDFARHLIHKLLYKTTVTMDTQYCQFNQCFKTMEVAIVIEVTLQDCDGIEPPLKERAEARFIREIQKIFPDEQSMLDAWRAYMDAAEGGEINAEQERLARSWLKAFDKARQAGFQGISVEEAYFDVRMG